MAKLFICKVTYTKSLSEVEKIVTKHREYLTTEGYDKGLLLASGPMIPKTGGIIIARFDTKEQAIAFAKNDPYCIHEVASYDISEFEAVLSDACLKDFL